MYASYQPSREFVELVKRVVSGDADDAHRERFDRAVYSDPAALDYFLNYLDTTQVMKQRAPPVAPFDLPLTLPDDEPSKPRRRIPLPFVIAAALSFLAAWGLAILVTLDREKVSTVGTWIEGSSVRWSDDRPPLSAGQTVPRGRGEIDRGIARIKLDCGATVTLEGPIDFTLQDAKQFHLESGLLRAQVPAGTRWFAVNGRSLVIIAKQADFGVIVGEDTVEVHVFAGEVSINRRLFLRANEAQEIDTIHRKAHEIPVDPTKFPALQ